MYNIVGSAVVSSIALFLFIRYRIKMTSLLTWIVGSLRSSRAINNTSKEDSEKSEHNSNKPKLRLKVGKVRQRPKKSNDDPTFSTNLITPIEDIIEESIKDEANIVEKKKGKCIKTPSSSEKSKKSKPKQDLVDDVGYSFFNVHSVAKVTSDTKFKKPSTVDVAEDNQSDDIGFSFLPIREKGKRYKSKTEIKNQDLTSVQTVDQILVKTKYDTSQLPIIDNYQGRKGNEKSKKFVASHDYSVIQKKFENHLKTEHKESKKVTSTVSFASVVSNSPPVEFGYKEESTVDVDAALDEQLSQNDKASINLIESCSSSIEVLNEFSLESLSSEITNFDVNENKFNTDFEQSSTENSTIIEKNIQGTSSNRSSICVIENQEDFEVIQEIIPKKQVDNSFSFVNNFERPEEVRAESKTVNEVFFAFEQDNHYTPEIDNFSQGSFKNETQNYLSENQPISYSFENTNSKEYLKTREPPQEFHSAEVFFTELAENSTLTDSNISYLRFGETHSVLTGQFENTTIDKKDTSENNTTIDKKDTSGNSVLKLDSNLNQDNCTLKVDYLLDTNHPGVELLETKGEVSDPNHPLRGEFLQEVEHSTINNKSEEIVVVSSEEFKSYEDKFLQIRKAPEESGLDFKQDNSPVQKQFLVQLENQRTVDQKEIVTESKATVKQNQTSDNFTRNYSCGEQQFIVEEDQKVAEKETITNERLEIVDDFEEIKYQTSLIEDLFPVTTETELLKEPVDSEYTLNKIQVLDQITSDTREGQDKDLAYFRKTDQKDIVQDLYNQLESQDQEFKLVEIIEHHQIETEYNKVDFDEMQQIRVLTLNDHEHQECTIYRIEKNWQIQFRIGPSLFGRKVFLYCNYPTKSNNQLHEFNRNNYQLLEWSTDEGCENADDTALFTQIKAELAGSFHYYFTYDNEEEKQGSGYFLVDPILKYGLNEELPLDCVQCQTVLVKSLGSFSTWDKKLQVTKESGYNMIHFSPIQELGASNSAYCLSEQTKLNPVFQKSDGKMPTYDDIEKYVSKLRKDWKIASICDIVLNHTANESKWLLEHPEVTYNCSNCPYMRPAYLLDAAWSVFSDEIKKGNYEDRGIPTEIDNEDHLNAIRYHFRASVLDPLEIHELFTCDISKIVAEFLTLARSTEPKSRESTPTQSELQLIQDPEYRRLSSTVDMNLALKSYNVWWQDTFDEDSRLKKCAELFKSKLDTLNNCVINEINGHLNQAIENVLASIRYYRVQHDGPKAKEITKKNPLVYRYFTDYGNPKTLKEYEDIMYSDKGRFLMAHNGWVMNSDPLRNFAASNSKVYLRRELIAWGDSVKLRYGDKPEDCPFLWNYMKKYVEQTARIFDGVRLDNCHSTPIPVAEYLLDSARRVRPDLYVVAELFTNSDLTDNIFVNRLGITSLIREAMSAWDSHEEGRLVYRYGGSPVGSFQQPNIRPLVPSVAHALFLDLTHDNPSPVEKRSVFDMLPSAALVNMSCCASGSNRGYDELVPHHIHVVDEYREYTEWTANDNLSVGSLKYVTHKSGIIKAKKALNDLHFHLGKEGFSQVYVDQMDSDIVAVTRHCPVSHQSYILVAFTAFGHPDEHAENSQRGIKPLQFEGVLEEIVLEATLSHVKIKSGGPKYANWRPFAKDSKYINGLPDYEVFVKQHIQVSESDIFEKVDSGTQNMTQLNFKNFKPGSIVIVRTSLPKIMSEAVKTVRNFVDSISITKQTDLSKIVAKMTLADMNRTIYRCDREESDEGFGFGAYDIPDYGPLFYTGLQGITSILDKVRPSNDLGHPVCANLRNGNWMIDYVWQRLKVDPGTKELGEWIEQNAKSFVNIPRYLIPCYFDMVISKIYTVVMNHTFKLMSDFVKNGSTFVQGLALGSVQFSAYIHSARLPALSPNLAPPKPATRKVNNETVETCVTLCAGLPHFTINWTRNWGRDTFIALRGMLILTGRYQDAREHILGYGGCMRHGLIPNLLDGGKHARFNCRDAIWYWLYCIKEYVNHAPGGIKILSDKVSRLFPTDDSEYQPPGTVDQPLYDVIQEGLKVHFQGMAFRERNAGKQLDQTMSDAGFNNQVGIHPETGFVFGGNRWNCGTWLDKMGSSGTAGNLGVPATPRDGSAVEMVGLCKCVISWLALLSQENKYPYKGVERVHKNGKITHWSFKEWAQKIQNNFENYFWIDSQPREGEITPDLINKRGIYKDSLGSTLGYTDFQLRPNFPIAMVVAPELFNPNHAWEALSKTEKYLLGPLGMKTLDPEDWEYRGDYDNSNQSDDYHIAHGFNYHQGPEWVWPMGYFLRAKLAFAAQNGALKETVAQVKVILSKHFVEIQTTDWRGIPELTNSNASFCVDSSRTQAWSMGCILEVLYDLKKIESSLDARGN